MSQNDKDKGLYTKYSVTRRDGSSEPGQKHADCSYFVLDINHDRYATVALRAYAKACAKEYPQLAKDLLRLTENEKSSDEHGIWCRCRSCE